MTRKDYITLADALKEARPAVLPKTNVILDDTARKVWFDCVSEVAAVLARDNSRFDRTRFFDRAGVPDCGADGVTLTSQECGTVAIVDFQVRSSTCKQRKQ